MELNKEHFEDFKKFLDEKGFGSSAFLTIDKINDPYHILLFEENKGTVAYKARVLVKEYYSKARVIKKECGYCLPQGQQAGFIADEDGLGIFLNWDDKGELNIYSPEQCTDFEIKLIINYCPMCGRKLGE